MIEVERLKNVEIFKGLTDEQLAVVARFCQEEIIREGTTLCSEGARAENLFILESGAISVQFKKGVHFNIETPGKILGWSFLVPPNRYTASAITLVPSRLLVIKSPDFYDLVHHDSQIGLIIMDNLSQVVASRMKAFVDYY